MAVKVHIKPAEAWEAGYLALFMRPVEQQEIFAAEGKDPHTAVLEALRNSIESYSVYFDGHLACMWGVVPRVGGPAGQKHGVAWLMTTRDVERKPITFWKLCLATLPTLLLRWDVLANAIDVRHTQAIRWAKRLGFVLMEAKPMGKHGELFQPFAVGRADLCAQPV